MMPAGTGTRGSFLDRPDQMCVCVCLFNIIHITYLIKRGAESNANLSLLARMPTGYVQCTPEHKQWIVYN